MIIPLALLLNFLSINARSEKAAKPPPPIRMGYTNHRVSGAKSFTHYSGMENFEKNLFEFYNF